MVSYQPTPGPAPTAPGVSLQPQAVPPGPPTVWPGAKSITGGYIADETLLPEHVADPDVFFARKTRYAAFSGRGPKGKGQWASIAWGATAAADFTLSATVSSRETLVNNTNVVGTEAAGRASFFVRANGRVVAYFAGSTLLVDTADAAISFDGSVYVIAVRFYQSGANVVAEVRINGELKATGSTAGTLTTTGTGSVVIGGTSANSVRWPGAIWNVSLTDNATPANSVVLRMDERAGNYRNSYSGTTAAAYATRNGVVDAIEILDTDGSALPVPAVPPARMRYAACSGLGASSTGGFFAEHGIAAMTSTYSVRVGASIAASAAPVASCGVYGRGDADQPTLYVNADGSITLKLGTTTVGSSAAGAVAFNGSLHDLRADVAVTGGTSCTASVYVNGALVYSASGVAVSVAAPTSNRRIGAATPSVQRWPGSIHNVEFTDYVTAANSLFYLMDEVSGSYADTSGNGGAAATRNGYVPTCAVVSADGRGMVYQGGRPLRYAGYRNAAYVIDGALGASANLQLDNETLDPTSSLALGADQVWVAPCAGIVTGQVAITLEANADPADSGTFMVKDATNEWAKVYVEIGARAEQGVVTIPFIRSVAAGDYARIRCEGIAATTGCTVTRVEFSLTLDPTPVAN